MYSLYMKGKMQQILQIENTGQSLFPGLYVRPGKKKRQQAQIKERIPLLIISLFL